MKSFQTVFVDVGLVAVVATRSVISVADVEVEESA